MSGPLHIFRRHQKALLAVFGVLIMITFTVGGVITSYQNRNTGYAGNTEVVLTWKHGKITEQQMISERNAHNLTVRFLDALIAKTTENGGTPKGPGLSRDQQGRVLQPGIPRSFAEEDLVRTKLLAQKATDMGMTVSEEAIFQFLDTLSDDVVSHSQYGEILSSATGGNFVKLQLFDRLAIELQAQNMRMLAGSGLFSMNPFSMSPGLAWDYFNRLNRRVKIEAVALPVDDFKSKVSAQPTDAQVKQLYEDGKDRYFDPYSSEPGFKQRQKIAFEYVKADFESFLAKEMAAVTDEQVQEYYEENKSDFKALELPSTDEQMTPPEDETAEPTDGASLSETPAEETPEDSAPMPEESDAAEATETAAEPEATEAPEASDEATEEPAVDLQAPANETPDAADTPAPEGTDTPSEADQSRAEMIPAFATPTFVSLPAQEDGAADEASGTEPADTEPADGATESPAESQPEPEAAVEETPAEETPASNEPPVETADDSTADEASTETDESEQETKYKPLEEVADEIRRNLARPPAQEAMNEAIKGARTKVEKYYTDHAKWDVFSKDDPELPEPVKPDTQALAAEFGLIAGDTPLVDVLEVADYELGKAYRFNFAQGQMARISFAEIAFTSGLPLYKTDQIRSFEVDVEFLYWKIEEKKPEVPELKDIRDEVIDFWKTQEAFALAKADAESLAEKATGDKPLRDSLSEQQAKEVFESDEFSWLTRGPMAMGAAPPRLSSVEGIDTPGDEFMQSVFDLQVGETGVATNAPKTVVYVVRMVSESPAEEQRRQQFLASGMSYDTAYVAMAERQRFLTQWQEDLDKEMQVSWKRQPDEMRDY